MTDRQTTEQIKKAPKDSFFVWHSSDFHYPRQLCKALGRDDIRLISASDVSYRIRGRRIPVIIDHYAQQFVSSRDLDFIKIHNKKVGYDAN